MSHWPSTSRIFEWECDFCFPPLSWAVMVLTMGRFSLLLASDSVPPSKAPIVKEVWSQDLLEEPQKSDIACRVILRKEEEEEDPFAAEEKGELVPKVEQQPLEEVVAQSEMEKAVEVDKKDMIQPEDHEPEISRDPEVLEGELEATHDKCKEIELPSETLISPKKPIEKEEGASLATEGEGESVTQVEQPALAESVGEPKLEQEEHVYENESIPGLEVEHEPDALKELEVVEGEPTEATKDESREIELPFETPSREEPTIIESIVFNKNTRATMSQ